MTMEKQPVEDVSPIKNAEFSVVMLVFRGVPGTKCHANWFLGELFHPPNHFQVPIKTLGHLGFQVFC